MGMVCETDGGVAIAAKPKERQFQVVPMPGVFSRGRWKCWDYKDSADTPAFNREERDILEFDARADRAENLVPNAAAVQEEPIFLTPPREVGEHPATSTIMVTSMALHESSPRISQAPSAVSSLTLEAASITIASLPPNISVGGSSDFHRPGTIPPMQSPSLPATVVNTTISSLTSTSYGTTMTMLDATSNWSDMWHVVLESGAHFSAATLVPPSAAALSASSRCGGSQMRGSK
uniref:Uncharacterized protein n=1 Tax=Plectus sambesii TaxID=2011161 RepID=A0A914W625_9BILA